MMYCCKGTIIIFLKCNFVIVFLDKDANKTKSTMASTSTTTANLMPTLKTLSSTISSIKSSKLSTAGSLTSMNVKTSAVTPVYQKASESRDLIFSSFEVLVLNIRISWWRNSLSSLTYFATLSRSVMVYYCSCVISRTVNNCCHQMEEKYR